MEQILSLSEVPAAATRPDTAADFTNWVEPHWAAMSALAARFTRDPDDILQDALVVAWRHRHRYDPDRGTPRTWLLTIVADQRRKAWRRAQAAIARTNLATGLARHGVPAGMGAHAGTPASPEAAVDLERALRRLSPRQRLAVDLHYFLGVPIAEAAAVMRCSEGTVKSTLADARARLRNLLGEDYR